jgi:hypothetical protein
MRVIKPLLFIVLAALSAVSFSDLLQPSKGRQYLVDANNEFIGEIYPTIDEYGSSHVLYRRTSNVERAKN